MVTRLERSVLGPGPREKTVRERRSREDARPRDDGLARQLIQLGGEEEIVRELDDLGARAKGCSSDCRVADAHTPLTDLSFLLQIEQRVRGGAAQDDVLARHVQEVDVEAFASEASKRALHGAPQVVGFEATSRR